jgi:ribosomal protein L37E
MTQAPLSQSATVQPNFSTTTAQQVEKICPRCGGTFSSNIKYCGRCGYNLS